jgi:hypothetical protein
MPTRSGPWRPPMAQGGSKRQGSCSQAQRAHRCSSRAGDHCVAAEEEPTAVAGVRGSGRQCARYTVSPATGVRLGSVWSTPLPAPWQNKLPQTKKRPRRLRSNPRTLAENVAHSPVEGHLVVRLAIHRIHKFPAWQARHISRGRSAAAPKLLSRRLAARCCRRCCGRAKPRASALRLLLQQSRCGYKAWPGQDHAAMGARHHSGRCWTGLHRAQPQSDPVRAAYRWITTRSVKGQPVCCLPPMHCSWGRVP